MLTTAGAARLIAWENDIWDVWVNNQSLIFRLKAGRKLGINKMIKPPMTRPENMALKVAASNFDTIISEALKTIRVAFEVEF